MIREAEKKDIPRIRELHKQLEARMGVEMDLPAIDDLAVLAFWVIEIDGEVVEWFYIEECLEACFGGMDPRATAEVRQLQGAIVERLLKSRARVLHCHVPKEFPDVGKHLEDKRSGFTRTGYDHFMLGLVKK